MFPSISLPPGMETRKSVLPELLVPEEKPQLRHSWEDYGKSVRDPALVEDPLRITDKWTRYL